MISIISWRMAMCEKRGVRFRFNETVTPMGGLGVYAAATGDAEAAAVLIRALGAASLIPPVQRLCCGPWRSASKSENESAN